MALIDQTLAVVLAGGDPHSLWPLTTNRAKPAVPFGGNYRIIDFSLSNCLHSGLRRIWVLTRFNSLSLQSHLRDGWSVFNPELGEFITPVPPQRRASAAERAGSASELAQSIALLERSDDRYVIVLQGDHVYRMDYAAMVDFHVQRGADVTLAALEVNGHGHGNARSRVVVDDDDRIVAIQPLEAATGDEMSKALASMDVLVFDREFLKSCLKRAPGAGMDLTEHVLPDLLGQHRVLAYRFGGQVGRVTPDHYWRNLADIDAYFGASMDLLKLDPPLDLYQIDWPIRSYQPQTPPAKTTPGTSSNEGIAVNSIMAGGVLIAGGGVNHSILFPQVTVQDAASVEHAILMSGVVVGEGAQLRRCIVDKGVSIPARASVGFDAELDRTRFEVTGDGVVVVPQGYDFASPVKARSRTSR